MTRSTTLRLHAAPAALAAALALAACTGPQGEPGASRSQTPAASAGSGSAPSGTAAQAPAQAPDGVTESAGVVVYRDYAAVVAREGDTLRQMAERVGLSPSELAAYNGLPTSYLPKPGDELVLPPRPEGYRASTIPAAEEAAPAPLSQAPAPADSPAERAAETDGATRGTDSGWDPARIGAAIDSAPAEDGADAAAAPPDPVSGQGYQEVRYHEVGAEETIYSIARRYGVPAERLISWNALSGPNYAVTRGQVLVIPGEAAGPGPQEAAASPTPPGEAGDAAPPPSAGRPLPPDTVAPRPLESPQLGRFQSQGAPAPAQAPEPATPDAEAGPASEPVSEPVSEPEAAPSAPADARTATRAAPEAGGGRFIRPVQGEVLRPYSRDPGGARNDGVDFAAEPGEPVRAAADGTVALVSTSLGEWGNIILLRHEDRLMTVYGRMGTVAVSKGEQVRAGDVLGDVAEAEDGPASLHFEVRRGAFTENPADYF